MICPCEVCWDARSCRLKSIAWFENGVLLFCKKYEAYNNMIEIGSGLSQNKGHDIDFVFSV